MFLSFDRGVLLLVNGSTKSVYKSIRKVHYMAPNVGLVD